MRKINIIKVLSIFFLFFIVGSSKSYAESNNLSFSMNIVQPDNQLNKSVTYFDILVKPKDTQKLELQITNTGKTIEKILVTPTNAITNAGGVLDYSIQEEGYKYDETLKIPFTSLVSEEQEVTVQPGETKTISFDFKAPDQEFDGLILGGFLAKTIDNETETEKTKNKVSFINKFQLVKAVMIRNTEDEIVPNIKLNEVKPALHNYRTAVIANIQNTTPVLLKNVQVKADIYKSNSSKVMKSVFRNDIELAPNTNFDFPIMWGTDRLEAGEYKLNLTIITENKEFMFDKTFNISKEDSYNINQKAINVADEKNGNLFLIILGVIFGVIIITLLILIIYRQNKMTHKKKNKTKIEHKKTKNKQSKK